jgi:Icc protein
MRIVQLTDIHIGEEGETHHDVDVRANFLKVLSRIQHHQPDRIVISGDLCLHHPELSNYEWIAQQLTTITCPTIVMPGNHDAQRLIQQTFDTKYHADTDEIYAADVWNQAVVLFLDTARGEMSSRQYQWLQDCIAGPAETVIIFMHHPPVYCGVPYMDMNYAFREIADVQKIFTRQEKQLNIFCGHYHVERSIAIANQRIEVTPSTFFQIDANEVDFKIDHKRPGYRVIEIDEDEVKSACWYV